MKTLSFILYFLFLSLASFGQSTPIVQPSTICTDKVTDEIIQRQLHNETVHQPLGDKVVEVYFIQYGVFLVQPTNLPQRITAYPFLVSNDGTNKTMWFAFYEDYFYRKEDALVIVHALKSLGVCQPFVKKGVVGI